MSGIAKAQRISSYISICNQKGIPVTLHQAESMGRFQLQKEIRRLKGIPKKQTPVDEHYSSYDKMLETKRKKYKGGYNKT